VSKFKAGDLVKPIWENNHPLIQDVGIVLDVMQDWTKANTDRDWTVYNIYWFQAGQTYPVFANDLVIFEEKNESNS